MKDNRCVLGVFLVLFASFGWATNFDKSALTVREILTEMVKADTTNPPGNEGKIVSLVAKRLGKALIKYELSEFAPGRKNIVARLKGTGPEKPLLLLAHLDVVGTKNQNWTSPPHSVTEKEGYLYGRGVTDDLGMAAVSLELLINLKKLKIPLRRDVILALTGDEESDGLGIQYLLKHKPNSVDAVVALNEGGSPYLDDDGKVKYLSFETAEKTYQDFSLIVKGTTGHSSVPLSDNAIFRLSAALDRLAKAKTTARLVPAMRGFFKARAKIETGALAKAMTDLAESSDVLPETALLEVEKDPALSACLRTTCVATIINGGTRENALPASASANINCRILPDETAEQVQKRLADIIQDPNVEIIALKEFHKTEASPLSNEVPFAILKVSKEMWPGVPVIPGLALGASDSRFLREHGIAAYGMSPFPLSEDDDRRAHGIDERVRVSSIRSGVEYFYRLVTELAEKH